ncbi:biotin--[acetyl-CoA-carboxylase] ligase [Sandarakinorhabdus sp.]|uniref:biotin--[acetyl-CoA-carboxylase] ligase n=1 Tax=Sandarakinorhabdus sp. TaxID=1916663 RepID=UPI00286EB1D1|nr:biotin--[acetyl-CoA-carboxylase] ligase [Sandarakinorhabdus sp.]
MSAAITHLAEVGSTNDWLLARADTLPDGSWVVADRQTAGRGRRGRVWSDGAGNLMASVLVRSDGPVQQLSFVAALALIGALDSPSLTLKWPNDVLLDGAKLAGILLERQGDALVIGFGVNLAGHPLDTERAATSFAAAGLPAPAPLDLLQRLAASLADWRAIWSAQGFAPIRTAWLGRAAVTGARMTSRLGTEAIEGVFEGLAEDGALLLRLDDGQLRAIHAGEVFSL